MNIAQKQTYFSDRIEIEAIFAKIFKLLSNPLKFKLMPESFNPDTGTFISLSEAEDMVSAWETLQSNMSIPISVANPKAHAFGINKIKDITDQSGCEGIRIYNGYYDSNRRLIIVGVDEDGNDMTSGYILEFSNPCPPNCAPNTAIH